MPKANADQTKVEATRLIEQFINNENNVLEKTYKHNFKLVRSYVLKNNGKEADAKDVFQEAMIVTWMNLKEGKFEVRNEFSLSAYIYQIAKHKWLDKLKSNKNKLKSNIPVSEFKNEEIEIENIYRTEEKLNYLISMYKRLDNKCKEVLNHFYFERKSLEEIASQLNYDTGSIRTIKYRCMQKLRKMHEESINQID